MFRSSNRQGANGHQARLIVWLLTLALLGSLPSGCVGGPDPSSPAPYAEVGSEDSGGANPWRRDAAPSPEDASAPGDASIPADTAPPEDASPPEDADGGPPPPADVGPEPRDASRPSLDAGPAPVDAGSPPPILDCAPGRWVLSPAGSPRQVRVEVPANLVPGAPLFIALHGNGDTEDNFCLTTGICADVTRRGAIAMAPYGPVRLFRIQGQQVQGAWHAYSTDPNESEDLALLDSLVQEARRRCAVGDIYVWGHSQGGYMAFLYAMARGDDVKGAVISAASDPLLGTRWPPTPIRPFFFLIGNLDPGLNAARASAAQLEAAGHRVSLRVLNGVGHGGHPRGYNDEILEFMLTPR